MPFVYESQDPTYCPSLMLTLLPTINFHSSETSLAEITRHLLIAKSRCYYSVFIILCLPLACPYYPCHYDTIMIPLAVFHHLGKSSILLYHRPPHPVTHQILLTVHISLIPSSHFHLFSKFLFKVCSCECMPPMCRCSWKPEEGVRSSGAGVTGLYEPANVDSET